MQYMAKVKYPFIDNEPTMSFTKVVADDGISIFGKGKDTNKGNEEIRYEFTKSEKKTEIEINGDADPQTCMKIMTNIMNVMYGD